MFTTSRKLSRWFNITIENPFKTWWKARKYFKFPKIRFQTFNTDTIGNYGKLLEFECLDLMWKDKWNSPRHEINPHIRLVLFNRFGFQIDFGMYYLNEFGEKSNGDMEYWEYILDWLYYKERKTLRCYSSWSGNSQLYRIRKWENEEAIYKPMKYVIPCVSMSLNKEGIKKLKKELNAKA